MKPDDPRNSGVPLKEQIIITIWEFYSSLGLLTDGQRRVLFGQMDRVLNKIAEVLADCFDPDGELQRALPILLVTLHDQRYATWTHYGELYDLDEERQIDELEEPAISMIACNVMAAYTRLHKRLRKLRKAHESGRPSHQASPPGSTGSET